MVLAGPTPPSERESWHNVVARLGLRRRMIAAVLAGIAVIATIAALRPPPAATRAVWVAARDLPGGLPIAAADVTVERLPTRDVPAGALSARASPVGLELAAPMRRGEPITDVRLLSASLLAATDEPGALAVPIRVADGPAALALVHAGDTVDVIAVADSGGGPPGQATVVHDVRVLATPAPAGSAAGSSDGSGDLAGLLIVEANRRQATALARAATNTQLSVAVQRPS